MQVITCAMFIIAQNRAVISDFSGVGKYRLASKTCLISHKCLLLAGLPWLQACGPVLLTKKKKKIYRYITKCDVKVMADLNFSRKWEKGKPAAIISLCLGGEGDKITLFLGGGNLSLVGGFASPPSPRLPSDAPGTKE